MRREVGEEWLGSVRRGVRDRLGSSPGDTMEQSQAQEVTYATIRRPSAQNVRSAVEAAHFIGGDRHRRFAGSDGRNALERSVDIVGRVASAQVLLFFGLPHPLLARGRMEVELAGMP